MVVLDTDHASELGMRSSAGFRLLDRLDQSGEEPFITAVTVEEQLRGWLAEIRRYHDPARQIPAYDHLVSQVELLALWPILPWDQAAVEIWLRLRSQRIRAGSQDLKIAAITIANGARLLTRNTADFIKVPALRIENWLD